MTPTTAHGHDQTDTPDIEQGGDGCPNAENQAPVEARSPPSAGGGPLTGPVSLSDMSTPRDELPDDLTVAGALPVVSKLPTDASPDDHAAAAGLVYVSDDEPGLARLRCGTGFTFRFPDGRTVPRDDPQRRRAEALAIPPAWTDVWVCRDPDGHIQATGRDDAGRKQYLYHPRWRGIRDATKFHRLGAFADALPRIRAAIDERLRTRRFTDEKLLALALALLDETLIRVGNGQYARDHGTFGVTTLEEEHVEVDGSVVRFSFTGKSGSEREFEIRDRRLARQLLRCEEIPGQRLFAYEDEEGWHEVDSTHVNDYLTEVAGDTLTAKDFRTWGATVLVADHLHTTEADDADRNPDAPVLEAIDQAAERLGNTRAVARDSYVDPRVTEAYRRGHLDDAWDRDPEVRGRLSPAERAVQRILDRT